jgi:hypothetical protein
VKEKYDSPPTGSTAMLKVETSLEEIAMLQGK